MWMPISRWPSRRGPSAAREALQLVSYNLAKLTLHITTSRRILNDLRTLRRLLLAERQGEGPGGQACGWRRRALKSA